jgi:HlyD family secretion protein
MIVRKTKQWKTAILLISLAMILPLCTIAANTASPTAVPEYTEVELALGSITKTVIATGSLRFDVEENLKLSEDVTLSAIDVQAGDVISKGQVIAHYDTEKIEEAIEEAQTTLDEQDETILSLLSQQTSEQRIKPAMAGVVKAINLEKGQMVQETLQGEPAAVLSVDGLMQVLIVPSTTLSLGQELKVKLNTSSQTGTVARLFDDGSVLITFPDTKVLAGETVQITLDGVTIGEGVAQINLPYYLYTDVDGVVESVSAKVNTSVTTRNTIIKVSNAEPNKEYLQAVEEREEKSQELENLKKILKEPVYKSTMDGIVSEVSAQTDIAQSSGTVLIKVYPKQALVLDVSVDELDILSVEEGQEGTVALDALTGANLPVKVERISRLGSTSSGITNYTVTLSVKEDSRLLSGMNGTVTLSVGEETGTVLVPLSALMNDRQGSYVLLKDTTLDESEEQSGIKTYVTTGLSDANYVAVSSGVKAGDIVLVRTSALSDTRERLDMPDFSQMQPPEGFSPGGGGNFPPGGGGNFQPGGGQRP